MQAHARAGHRGFTLVELVGVMVLVGILAIVALPRLSGSAAFQRMAFRDEVAAALRYAQKSAVSRGRLVCAVVSANSVTLYTSASRTAPACTVPLSGPDGNASYALSSSNLVTSGTGTVYFQPSGLVTTAGGAVSNFSIGISGESPVTITGSTGHVS